MNVKSEMLLCLFVLISEKVLKLKKIWIIFFWITITLLVEPLEFIGIFPSHFISFKIDLCCNFFVNQEHWLLFWQKICQFQPQNSSCIVAIQGNGVFISLPSFIYLFILLQFKYMGGFVFIHPRFSCNAFGFFGFNGFCSRIIGLAYQGKDIVFKFIIEYSS